MPHPRPQELRAAPVMTGSVAPANSTSVATSESSSPVAMLPSTTRPILPGLSSARRPADDVAVAMAAVVVLGVVGPSVLVLVLVVGQRRSWLAPGGDVCGPQPDGGGGRSP